MLRNAMRVGGTRFDPSSGGLNAVLVRFRLLQNYEGLPSNVISITSRSGCQMSSKKTLCNT